MPVGPGKYDDLCTYVRKQAKAAGVIVIIFDGKDGAGFSMQADPITTFRTPSILRTVADEIEASFKVD